MARAAQNQFHVSYNNDSMHGATFTLNVTDPGKVTGKHLIGVGGYSKGAIQVASRGTANGDISVGETNFKTSTGVTALDTVTGVAGSVSPLVTFDVRGAFLQVDFTAFSFDAAGVSTIVINLNH